MRKTIISLVVIASVIITLLFVEKKLRNNQPVSHSQNSEAEKILPSNLFLTDFKTKEKISLDRYKNKVVLINFWASWCEACMAEMPSIQKLYNLLKGDGFEVIAINVDDNPEKIVPSVINKLNLTFSVYTDPNGDWSKEFDVVAIPLSALISKKNKIVWAESGERDWSSTEVVNEVKKLLSE